MIAVSTILRLPPERFYWSVLRVEDLPRRSREQLGYLFEDELPVPVDEVQAAFASVSNGEVLACGIRHADLEREIEAAPVIPTMVVPDRVPEEVHAGVEPAALNLLTGRWEPRAVQRLRRQLTLLSVGIVLILAALLVARFEVGAHRHGREQQLLTLQRSEVYRQVIGDAGGSALPIESLATVELRRLRQTRTGAGSELEEPDVSRQLAGLLALWPAGLHMTVEHLSITDESITVRGPIPESDDAQTLADALGGLPGWTMEQPEVTRVGGGLEVVIRFLREVEA